MNAPAPIAQGRALAPIKQFQQEVDQREASFAASLPAHIPLERFKRVVLRAVQKTPALLAADRVSLLSAAMDAANDGLLPDGREGAMVIYNTKQGNGWIKKVQWMPMVFGVLKKIRNSGELKSITARLVYGGDHFRYWIDEHGEHIQYEAADNPDKSIFRRAFALAITKDDGRYIEVMDAEDVEKVRAISRAKDNGPWVDWWEEMAKKTVIRRLAKRLPMSTDLDDLMRRDDALYDFEAAKEARRVEAPRSIGQRLDALADMTVVSEPDENEGNKKAKAPAEKPAKNAKGKSSAARAPRSPDGGATAPSGAADKPPSDDPPASDGGRDDADTLTEPEARRRGAVARAAGMSRKATPAEFREDERLELAWLDGFDTGEAEDVEPGAEED